MNLYAPALVKDALRVHTMVALVCGWMLYLICLSGTLAVIAEWIERLEQPDVPEFMTFKPTAPEQAIRELQQKLETAPETLYVVLPNSILPRMHVVADGHEWWVTEEGHLYAVVKEGLAAFIRGLHTHLHLPEILGMVIVSCFAVMLLLLIVSGIWSHPGIVKDAFKWRRDGGRMQQVDLHNRLSVWGLPFHLMFGLTGAMFGLITILVLAGTQLYFEGDEEAIIKEVYGEEPELKGAQVNPDIAAGLLQLPIIAQDAIPVYIALQNAGKDNAFYEIAASRPGRFAYSEIYHFSTDGTYLGSQQLTDGPVSRQWIYSIYRIHYGHFGDWLTRLIYVLLGLALCFICTSGMKSYFLRTRASGSLQALWSGFVWGAPAGFMLAGIAAVFQLSTLAAFFIGLFATLALSLLWQKKRHTQTVLQAQG